MKVRIEPEAAAEIEVAAAWYQKAAPGLGNEFLRAVQVAVSLVGRQPTAFAVAYVRTRRVGLRRFPWSLFYEVDTDQVAILACLHQHRDPQSWPER